MRIIPTLLLSLVLFSAPAYAGYKKTFNPDTGVGDFVGVSASRDIAVVCDSGKVLKSQGSGTWACDTDAGGVGSGDIDTVGDCVSGACFDGTQGTTLTFNNVGGDATIAYDGTDFDISDDIFSSKTATFGDATSSSAQLIVKGGSSGGDIIQLQRTSGATSTFGWALAGGGLTFKDVTSGYTVAGMYGDASINHISFGVRNQITTDTRADRISAKSFNSGADVNGTEFQIYGSLGTGAGTPGDINFYTADAGVSSSTTQSATKKVEIDGPTGALRLYEPSGGGNYSGFKAQAQAGDVTYTLPAADGSASQVLKTNASGTLSWGDPVIASGTAPTADDPGEIAHDTTDNQIILDDYVFTHKRQLHIPVGSPSTGTYLLGRAKDGMTILSIDCIVDPAGTGENTVIQVQECDSTGDTCADVDSGTDITCDNDGAADDGTLSNPSIDAGDWYALEIVSVSGTVTQANITIDYTTVRE